MKNFLRFEAITDGKIGCMKDGAHSINTKFKVFNKHISHGLSQFLSLKFPSSRFLYWTGAIKAVEGIGKD